MFVNQNLLYRWRLKIPEGQSCHCVSSKQIEMQTCRPACRTRTSGPEPRFWVTLILSWRKPFKIVMLPYQQLSSWASLFLLSISKCFKCVATHDVTVPHCTTFHRYTPRVHKMRFVYANNSTGEETKEWGNQSWHLSININTTITMRPNVYIHISTNILLLGSLSQNFFLLAPMVLFQDLWSMMAIDRPIPSIQSRKAFEWTRDTSNGGRCPMNHEIGVGDTISDSIRYLNFAEKWFNSIVSILHPKNSIQNKLWWFNSKYNSIQ